MIKSAQKRFKISPVCLLLLCCMAGLFALWGCSPRQEESTGQGQYDTYYVNQASTALVRTVYKTDTTDTESLIRELIQQCQTVPDETDGRRAIPSNVTMAQEPVYENGIVSIYFDNTYSLMDTVGALLCRAALAKTLTQLEEVDYIAIYINGKPYTGEETNEEGQVEGGPNNNSEMVTQPLLLSAADFVDNTGDATNHYEQVDLVLYFATPDGSGLVKEERSVVFSTNLSTERVIMNQLIAGPTDSRLTATLPAGMKVQSIAVKDGVCYVDLDDTFLTETTNVMGTVEIYSIVNSLTELSTINQVQFSVNASSEKVFRSNIPLSDRFDRNQDLIVEWEEEETETIPEDEEETTEEAWETMSAGTIPE